jgi:P27 family predicted phage terminase small subunit
MKNSKEHPPAHLSPAAKRWWKELEREYSFETPDQYLTLRCVLECYDRSEAAREIVAKEGAVIEDRFGQKKQHPATIVERDAKMAMLRGLRALGLDIAAPSPIGRPTVR